MYDRKEGGRSRTAGMDDVATMAERTHERTKERTVERENVKQIAKEERDMGAWKVTVARREWTVQGL